MKAQIRARLRAQRLTQRALAKRLGVTEGALSQILRAEGNPTVRTLARIAAALGCRLQITLEKPEPPPLSEQERLWFIAA